MDFVNCPFWASFHIALSMEHFSCEEDFLLESSVFVFVFAVVFVIVITGASLDSTRHELSESVFYVGL